MMLTDEIKLQLVRMELKHHIYKIYEMPFYVKYDDTPSMATEYIKMMDNYTKIIQKALSEYMSKHFNDKIMLISTPMKKGSSFYDSCLLNEDLK